MSRTNRTKRERRQRRQWRRERHLCPNHMCKVELKHGTVAAHQCEHHEPCRYQVAEEPSTGVLDRVLWGVPECKACRVRLWEAGELKIVPAPTVLVAK